MCSQSVTLLVHLLVFCIHFKFVNTTQKITEHFNTVRVLHFAPTDVWLIMLNMLKARRFTVDGS